MSFFKSKVFLGFTLIVLLFSLAACSSGTPNAGQQPAGETPTNEGQQSQENITIDMSLFYTENDAHTEAFKLWAELVNKETEGRVTFKPYYSAALVPLFDTLDAVRNGSVDAGVLSAGAVSGQIPVMGLLEIIGVFQEDEQYKAIYEEANSLLDEVLAKEGVKLLYWSPGQTDGLVLHKDQFISKVEQFQGLKMRTAGRWQAAQMEALGASPISMDPSELYLALQNGTVDSTIQGVNLANSQKLYEVTPKLASIGLSANIIPYVVNEDVWAKISPEDQETIEKISKQVGLQAYSMVQTREQADLVHMQEQGAELYTLTNEERVALLDVFNSVRETIAETAGEEGQKLLEILKKYE